MFQVKSNQYIPYRAKTLPSGLPACATYYYIVDVYGNTINKTTYKPYKGKQMDKYAIHDKEQADKLCEKINTTVDLFESVDTLPQEVQDIINKYQDDWEPTYENCRSMLKELEAVGYTFDYYLDAEPYDLRKIN